MADGTASRRTGQKQCGAQVFDEALQRLKIKRAAEGEQLLRAPGPDTSALAVRPRIPSLMRDTWPKAAFDILADLPTVSPAVADSSTAGAVARRDTDRLSVRTKRGKRVSKCSPVGEHFSKVLTCKPRKPDIFGHVSRTGNKFSCRNHQPSIQNSQSPPPHLYKAIATLGERLLDLASPGLIGGT